MSEDYIENSPRPQRRPVAAALARFASSTKMGTLA